MTDFASRLRAQKKALEDERLSQEEKRAVESAKENARFTDHVNLLQSVIQPILKECQQELQKEGMDLRIDNNFDVPPHVIPPNPTLQVFCGSPARRSDGYRFESRPLFIEVRDGQFGVAIGDRFARRAPSNLTEVSQHAVEDMLQDKLLELIDEALREWQSSPARDI